MIPPILRTRGWLWSCALLFLIAAAPPGGEKAKGPPPPLVEVEALREEQVAPTTVVSGTVEPLRESQVAARMAGVVLDVHAEPGDRVAADAPLLTLDPAEGERELLIRRAELAEARARLVKAEQDLERDRKLLGSDAVSRQRLAEREAEAAVRRALLQRAEAALALATDQRAWLTIRAPFAGVVAKRMPARGQWVGRGETVTALVDPEGLEILSLLPESLSGALLAGRRADAALGDGSGAWFPVTLRAVVPRLDPVSRNRATYWRADGAAVTGFLPGQEARLRLPSGEARPLLLIPKDAVTREKGENRVMVLDGETVRQAVVKLGAAVDGKLEVLSGLKAGERVVVRGNERVRPGQTVRIAANGGDKKPAEGETGNPASGETPPPAKP